MVVTGALCLWPGVVWSLAELLLCFINKLFVQLILFYLSICRLGAAAASIWATALLPHHQWLVLSVEHALVLLSRKEEVLKVRPLE